MGHPPLYPPAPNPLARSAADILPPGAPLVVPAAREGASDRAGHAPGSTGMRIAVGIALLVMLLVLTAS